MAYIYNAFGYDYLSVPYINLSDPKPRLKSTEIIARDLPVNVPTADYF